MNESIAIDFAQAQALFPLENCVLIPHSPLPLYIFEPRYVHMVEDAIDGAGVIAMGTFAGTVDQDEYFTARPAVRSVACLGYVAHYEHIENERYVIVLQGLMRARIMTEETDADYRSFKMKPMPDVVSDRQAVNRQSELICDMLMSAIDTGRIETEVDIRDMLKHLPADVVVDVAGAAVAQDAASRYALLSEADLLRRGEWVAERLKALV